MEHQGEEEQVKIGVVEVDLFEEAEVGGIQGMAKVMEMRRQVIKGTLKFLWVKSAWVQEMGMEMKGSGYATRELTIT